MDGKVLLQDLAEGLAERKHISKKEAEAFVRAAFELIEEGLLSDQLVKVKGIGTFKLVTVDSRESINVNTGERFTIDSHSKITFSPDKALSDRINRPFADFETTILNDGTKTEDMERIEPLVASVPEPEPEIVPEEKAEPVQEAPAVPEAEPVSEPEPLPEPEVEPVPEATPAPEPVADIVSAPVAEPESADKSELAPVQESEVAPVSVSETTPEPLPIPEEQPARKSRFPLYVGTTLLLLLLLGAWWFFGRQDMKESNGEEVVAEEVQKKTVKPAATVSVPDTLANAQPTLSAEERAAEYAQLKYGEYWIVGTLDTITLQRGDDLSKLALEYYGDKKLINYIIKHNGYSAAQANGLLVGARVKIPELLKKDNLTEKLAAK
ncbi:MAG: HU family DNA-binding protein [Bacteroidaceae bacterium]|nr:HU family DNA-binding protein [Bacteroidaceae bacterium]